MTFDLFQEYVKDHVLEGWREDSVAEIQTVCKNNGVTCHPLYVHDGDQVAVPSIYMEKYYQRYQDGVELNQIIEEIREEYELSIQLIPKLDWGNLSYSFVKDNIIFRLVNFEKNREILEDCPYIQLGDLAVTFRWIAHTDPTGVSSALISKSDLDVWNVTVDELLVAAQENTPRIFPPVISSIEDMIFNLSGETPDLGGLVPMYILTNRHGLNGATCMLYDNILKEFAQRMDSSIYILPSSIHEVILIPEDEVDDPSHLGSIVKDANESVVELGDILSDSVYYYNKATGTLSLNSN